MIARIIGTEILRLHGPAAAACTAPGRWVLEDGISLDGASDHGVSEALYLRDRDQNGVELSWDRPPADWPRTPEGRLPLRVA